MFSEWCMQMPYWYNWSPWWWVHVCSKHVEYRNKHTQKRIVRQVGYFKECRRKLIVKYIIYRIVHLLVLIEFVLTLLLHQHICHLLSCQHTSLLSSLVTFSSHALCPVLSTGAKRVLPNELLALMSTCTLTDLGTCYCQNTCHSMSHN